MLGILSNRWATMVTGAAMLLTASIKTISGLPTPAPTFYEGFRQGVTAETVWPSYLAHLSEAQPDKASGPQHNAFVYRIPGENQDIGTQVTFTMQENEDSFDDDNYEKDGVKGDPAYGCVLAILDMNKLWGNADWAAHFTEDQDFTIFGYLEPDVVLSPNDTWNDHPAVDYHNAIGIVHVNSTGIYVLGAEITCGFENNLAQFWLQAVDDQFCNVSFTESQAPLSGLVIQRYALS